MVKVSSIRKAAEHRSRVNEVKALVSFVKTAQEQKVDYIRRRRRLMVALMTLIGAGIGAQNGVIVGAARGGKGGVGKGALVGGGIGALAGLGIGAASTKVREWAGADPMVPTVAIAKD